MMRRYEIDDCHRNEFMIQPFRYFYFQLLVHVLSMARRVIESLWSNAIALAIAHVKSKG